ncbi:hypothetical protein CesoFtcFv8_027720 [Champsocephalus esox]|uniref:Peptidase M14 domain-containing protein n=1 Tax=Champsocephalus esox TaxID=159716 RepID=A0AAN7YD26_9TELE|nr:hypothetical protein CesoFtcFv8_027720 [Champsocephalus esox]
MLFSVGLSLVVLLSVVGAATVERVEYDYYKYHPMPEITDWMVQAVKDYPEVVTIVEYGQTYEKRTISLLKIGVNTGRKRKLSGWTVVYTPENGSPRPSVSTLSERSFKHTKRTQRCKR